MESIIFDKLGHVLDTMIASKADSKALRCGGGDIVSEKQQLTTLLTSLATARRNKTRSIATFAEPYYIRA